MARKPITSLGDLTPDPDNARKHNPRNLGMIERSIQEFGFLRPIVVDENGKILAGHGSAEAAAAAGLEAATVIPADGHTVLVVQAEHLTDEQKRAYGLLDNRAAELATWDVEKLASWERKTVSRAFTDEELARLLGKAPPREGNTDPDAVVDPPDDPITQPGDVWALGNSRLMCGDSTSPGAIDRLMAGQKAHMVFTDPPYGVGYEGGSMNAKKRERLEGDLEGVYRGWLANWDHFATGHTAAYIWFAGGEGYLTYPAVVESGLNIRSVIVWHKLNAHYGGYMAQYMQKHELCLYCHKGTILWHGPTNEVSIWEVEQPSRNEYHPTQKPVALAIRAMENSSVPGNLVVDLFAGSGSTFIAGHQTGRVVYGMELSPAYCDAIVARWEAFTGLSATREANP